MIINNTFFKNKLVQIFLCRFLFLYLHIQINNNKTNTMKNTQITTIQSILESYDITVKDNELYVKAMDHNGGLNIYLDTNNNIYTLTEMDDINGFASDYDAEEFYSFEDLIDHIENSYC